MDMMLTQVIDLFDDNDEVSTRVDGDYLILTTGIHSRFGTIVGQTRVRVHFTDIDLIDGVLP